MIRINPEQFEHEHDNNQQNHEETAEQVDIHAACNASLEQCQNDLALMTDRLKRISADFENFKKRVERDRLAWSDTLEAEFIKELLPVIDDFDRALAESRKKEVPAQEQALITGFELIAKTLYKFLALHNVQEITKLTTFDPEFHEAVITVQSPDHKPGAIVAVLQKGFMYKETVLRPAKVTVAA
jgi:molecular chaperone GrpE